MVQNHVKMEEHIEWPCLTVAREGCGDRCSPGYAVGLFSICKLSGQRIQAILSALAEDAKPGGTMHILKGSKGIQSDHNVLDRKIRFQFREQVRAMYVGRIKLPTCKME